MKAKKSKSNNGLYLMRYTNLPNLLDMLINQHLVLLSPATWEDKNDRFFIEKYREYHKLKTVLALCFTTKRQTFHHWKIFAGDASGVCIKLNKELLIKCFKNDKNVKCKFVEYKLLKDIFNIDKAELPFLKRTHYTDEAEFRIIYKNKEEELSAKPFKINMKCIEEIFLSPWLSDPVRETIKKMIKNIPECSAIKITKPGVVEYEPWKNIARKIEQDSISQNKKLKNV